MRNLIASTIWFYFLFVHCTTNIQAQTLVGKAYYKYKYDFPHTKDTLIGELYFDDLGKSFYVYSNTATIKQGPSTYQSEHFSKDIKRIDTAIVYRDLNTREYFYRKSSMSKNNLVSDTLIDIAWELLPSSENRKIGKFNCASAQGRVHGRNYQVWYTADIPISSGPWKLFGLPGLIVEAKDDQGIIYFALDQIEIDSKYKSDFGLERLRKNAISLQTFVEQEKRREERMIGQGKTMGVTVTIKHKSKGIELEDH